MKEKLETHIECPNILKSSPQTLGKQALQGEERSCAHRVIRKGFYKRKCDGRTVQRLRCTFCKINFSTQTQSDTFRMRKIWVHAPREILLCSGVSKRQCSRNLKISATTVERKIPFLAKRARIWQTDFLKSLSRVDHLHFDDLESFEHTKMKPLAVPLAVCGKRRFILATDVVQMPAKGHLAAKSRKKYGPRQDNRKQGWTHVLSVVANAKLSVTDIVTDEHPHYPKHLKAHFPKIPHYTTPGGRGCVAGYGELKKKGFDKMFALNHTCAMLRDHLACLKRRTWTTTKKPSSLKMLIEIYTKYHNQTILKRVGKESASFVC